MKNDRNPAGFFGAGGHQPRFAASEWCENNRVLREATRAGANVLKEEVVSRAPVRRGKLRRNVVVLSRRSRDGGMESGVISVVLIRTPVTAITP
ncbi:HK97 gp10 family phage protein [Escherichia coli]|nr:HK97 gp10 family phage protein [Escherichia coli]